MRLALVGPPSPLPNSPSNKTDWPALRRVQSRLEKQKPFTQARAVSFVFSSCFCPSFSGTISFVRRSARSWKIRTHYTSLLLVGAGLTSSLVFQACSHDGEITHRLNSFHALPITLPICFIFRGLGLCWQSLRVTLVRLDLSLDTT